ncbi:MAG: hypothetical protein ABH805_02195 [Candidatus Nealsonbacteria bacterium]
MDLNEIKQLIKEEGGKIILVEEGEPVLIISAYSGPSKKNSAMMKQETVKPKPEVSENELKVEDLPF